MTRTWVFANKSPQSNSALYYSTFTYYDEVLKITVQGSFIGHYTIFKIAQRSANGFLLSQILTTASMSKTFFFQNPLYGKLQHMGPWRSDVKSVKETFTTVLDSWFSRNLFTKEMI